jgi:hypothetical protein
LAVKDRVFAANRIEVVVPSPQVSTAWYVSLVPGSVNVAETETAVPIFAVEGIVALVKTGATLVTLTDLEDDP